jgi:DNA-binding MarR family transcriptional regulator
MTDLNAGPVLFLRDAELRTGIELLYFGYRDLTSRPDAILKSHGFGRAHHRCLHFIGRKPGLTVSDLLRLLQITKQSLARVLADLTKAGCVRVEVGQADKRQRRLFLSDKGLALERELFEALRERMRTAYTQAGSQAVAGFWQVLFGLVEPRARAEIERFVKADQA